MKVFHMPAKACLVVIGNEILSGRTQDANTIFIARRLAELGIALESVHIIPDRAARIVETVNQCRAAYDYVFTTGGIGPTHDDITARCIADAFGVQLTVHQETFDALMHAMGAEKFNAARQRMAYLPHGAQPIKCPASVAPGFKIGNVYVLAGVPRIMQSMFDALAPSLQKGPPLISATWRGRIGEGALAAGLENIQNRFAELDLGSYPYESAAGVHSVALVAKGYAPDRVAAASQEIRQLFLELGVTPEKGEPPVD